jgi:perosamine synthetase
MTTIDVAPLVTEQALAPIRISEPTLGPEVEALVLQVLRSGQLAQGPMVERFEALCAHMAGTRHAVAVTNGTVSLEACLAALGIGPGDEVIMPPLTFAATVNAALHAGATVRFADVGRDYTMDVDSVAALINTQTAAVMPVHLYGLPVDMNALAPLAAESGLAVVEDAAQAHGALVGDRPVGSYGLGSFSFYATKNVTAGEGGVITTDDDELARTLRLLRNQGMDRRYEYGLVGRNLRMTDLHAAVAIPQLERLEEVNARRWKNAFDLGRLLADVGVDLPCEPSGRSSAWHQFTVLLPDGADRSAVVRSMGSVGVHAGIYYPSLAWEHPAYRDHPRVVRDHTPVALSVSRRCLSLPIHPNLGLPELRRVAEALISALR